MKIRLFLASRTSPFLASLPPFPIFLILLLTAVLLPRFGVSVCMGKVPPASEPQTQADSSSDASEKTPLISLMPLAEEELRKNWSAKVNVKLSLNPESQTVQQEIDSSEFNFGWFQFRLPDADLTQYSGIFGRFRLMEGTTGSRIHAMVVQPEPGEPSEYYTQPLGLCSDSKNGEWIEFFLSFRKFKPGVNASRRSFNSKMLRPQDRLEISVASGTGNLKLEFDSLRLTSLEEEPELLRKVSRSQFKRALKPETEASGETHPRLLLCGKRLERVRAKAKEGGIHQAGFERLIHLAEEAMLKIDAEEPFASVFQYSKSEVLNEHKNRGRFEGTLNRIVIPLETLAAAAVITGNEKYARHAARALVNMARSLDAFSPEIDQGFYYTRTFYVRTLAFGYDWLWHYLTPEERRDVKVTLLSFIQNIYDHSWTDGWGQHPLHRVWNWNPGLVSCAGLGVLALEGETTLAEDAMLFEFRRHLRDYLTLGIDSDGSCHEGPSYISYGIGAGVQFAECLRNRGLGDLFTETNWQLIPPWLVSELLPNQPSWNNLSDCNFGQPAGCPVYAYTCGRLAELAQTEPVRPGERLPTPEPTVSGLSFLQHFPEKPGEKHLTYGALAELMGWCWNHGSMAQKPELFSDAPALAFVLFYEECPIAEDPGKYLPEFLHFRGRGLTVSRAGGYGKEALHLAVEAGPHASGHDQSDKGTFTFRAYGADFAIDSGYGNDGQQDKSGSSFAHNVVLIDGQGQPMRWHNMSDGEITGTSHSSTYDWIRTSALGAWNYQYSRWQKVPTGQEVEKADRHYVLIRETGDGNPPYLLTFDDFRKKDGKPHEFTWQWHTSSDFQMKLTPFFWQTFQAAGGHQVLTTKIGRCTGKAVFELTAPESGTYQIIGLTRCAGEITDKSDSFTIQVNAQKPFCWDLTPSRGFTWSTVKEREKADFFELELVKGEKVKCVLTAREPEAQLAFLGLKRKDADFPAFPDQTKENCQTPAFLDAASAKMDSARPFLLQSSLEKSTEANLTVFPVTTSEGKTVTELYEGTYGGMHPKLLHSVTEVEPEFLMVLVPRPNQAAPLPMVSEIRGTSPEFVGAEIRWPNGRKDRVKFQPGPNGMVPEVLVNF